MKVSIFFRSNFFSFFVLSMSDFDRVIGAKSQSIVAANFVDADSLVGADSLAVAVVAEHKHLDRCHSFALVALVESWDSLLFL